MAKKKKKPVSRRYNTKNEWIRSIFEDAAQTRRKSRKQSQSDVESLDLDTFRKKRRIAALTATHDEIANRIIAYHAPISLEEILSKWISANALTGDGPDTINETQRIDIAAAIWMLDQLRDAGTYEQAIHLMPISNTIRIEDITDPCSSDEVLSAAMQIIRKRNFECTGKHSAAIRNNEAESLRCFMDLWTADGSYKNQDTPSRQRFNAVIDLIPKQQREDAAAYFLQKCNEWIDLFFDTFLPLLEEQIRLLDQIDNLEKKKERQRDLVKTDMRQMVFSSKMLPANPEPPNTLTHYWALQKQIDQLYSQYESLPNQIPYTGSECLDLVITPYEEKVEMFGEQTVSIWNSFRIDDPYKLCFGFLACLEADNDMPWLYAPCCAVLSMATAYLPWARIADPNTQCLYETDIFSDQYKKLNAEALEKINKETNKAKENYRHLLYDMRYQCKDTLTGEIQMVNLVQLIYELSCGVMPRNLESIAEATLALAATKVSLSEELVPTVMCAAILANVQRRKYDVAPTTMIPPAENSHSVNVTEAAEQKIRELEQQLAELKNENMQLQKTAYETSSDNKKLRTAKEKLEQAHNLERQELIDLRELVFNQQESTYTEEPATTELNFPYEAQDRIVVFGGHDSWSREIRQKLPNVKFIDRTMVPNAQLIRNADVVWIQPNAISHAFFYKIIDEVRRYHIPLRYFSYASATKCAEQLVHADND